MGTDAAKSQVKSARSLRLKPLSHWNKWLTMILRIVVGAVFLFSGFVKAIDPWGTIYKVEDYLVAFGFSLPDSIVLFFVFSLFTVEFLIGVFIVLGCYRRVAPRSALLMMLFMLSLTLWIAVKEPVSDCGCFGDAVKLSNWATFWKNVILTIMLVWLSKYAYRSRCFVIPTLQWLALATSVIFVVIVSLFGYLAQPMIDFRPYPENELFLPDTPNTEAPTFNFIYSRNGEEYTFHQDSIPEGEEWTFVDRVEVGNKSSDSTDDRLLRIYDIFDDDVTNDVIATEGKQILLFYSSLDDVSISSTYQINSLYTYCRRYDISMVAIAGATPEQIEEWADLSMASYEIYIAEDTAIKEVVRGNPAVLYLVDGKVMFKSSLRAIDVDDFLSPDTSSDPMTFIYDKRSLLVTLINAWLLSIVVIIMLSHLPMTLRFIRRKIAKKATQTSAKD